MIAPIRNDIFSRLQLDESPSQNIKNIELIDQKTTLHLDHLFYFPNLEKIDISRSIVTQTRHLLLRNLEFLNLSETNVGDISLIINQPNLKEIKISHHGSIKGIAKQMDMYLIKVRIDNLEEGVLFWYNSKLDHFHSGHYFQCIVYVLVKFGVCC